ncbi:MAG: hypothetical protein ACRC35_09940 [Angustibacter sp.]
MSVASVLMAAALADLPARAPAPPTALLPTADPWGGIGTAATPARDEVSDRVAALTELLTERSRGLRAGDQEAWLAAVDPLSRRSFHVQQAAVFRRLRVLPLAEWRYQVLGRAGDLPADRQAQLGPTAWLARVRVSHRIAGFDRTSAVSEQVLTVVRRGSRWLLTADDDSDDVVPQPWDLGPVQVERSERVIAFGTGSRAELRRAVDLGDRAIDQVSAVWGTRWQRRAVLVVPATQREFGRLLQRPSSGLDQLAAVTTGTLRDQPRTTTQGLRQRAGNDRIVLNPSAFDRLQQRGQQVVLSHEMTHVATRQSTARAVPTWLSEGFADYVGYSDAGVDLDVAAADLVEEVRAGATPRALPQPEDFNPVRGPIASAYTGSWLACRVIAEVYGERRLVSFYRTASDASGTPQEAVETAFGDLGTTEQRFTERWREYLRDLAGM